MKESMKKILCLMMALVTCGSMVACDEFMGEEDDRTNPNADKILNIAYFNGGVSVEWLKELEKEYELAHPDVEISINAELKDELKNQQLMGDIKNRNEDIFFTHTINYQEFVNRDLLLDISDIVKAPAADGERTVEERMNANLRNYYNVKDHYYAVPFYSNFSGAIYDVDLFEEQGLYLAQGGGYTTGLEGDKPKSLGKDGIVSYDDGLPATFAEYKTWLNWLSKTRGIIPYIWCTDDSYRVNYLDSLQIGYEGMNDYSINITFNGTTKDGKVITPENAYEIRDLKGRQFAVEMAKEIIDNKYYHPDSVNGSITHTQAQNTFLRSRPDGSPIAMILEGGWWENEARSTFASIVKRTKNEDYAHGNRRFAYMPVPNYDENAESGETFYCTSGSVAVGINKSTKQADLAKDFLQFTLTEHAMSTFTKNIGLSRPYDYDLEDGVYEQLTPFGQNFWDLVNNENSKIYYATKSHEFKQVTTFFGTYEWAWGSKINGVTHVDPYLLFLNNKSVTVAQYLQGMTERYNATNYTAEYTNWLSAQK